MDGQNHRRCTPVDTASATSAIEVDRRLPLSINQAKGGNYNERPNRTAMFQMVPAVAAAPRLLCA